MATGRIPDPNSSPLTAKGDLYTYSTVPARLAVGNNGDTLVADSSSSVGLRWQSADNANAIINGGMDIWQRGTSSASNGITTADRFYCSSSAACTFSQDTTYVPDGLRYALKGLAGATTNIQYLQAIETANSVPFANKTVTLSAYVAASTSTAMELVLAYSTSTDVGVTGSWTNITATSGGTGTATTSVSRVSGVFAVPSTAKSLRILVGTSSTVVSSVAFYATGVQLELGSVATTFKRAGGTIQGERAACQRYYREVQFATGTAVSTTSCQIWVNHTGMRVAPSSAASAAIKVTNATSADYTQSVAGVSIVGNVADGGRYSSGNFTGMTVGAAANIIDGGGTIQLSAEL